MASGTAAIEWRAAWPLPFVVALATAGASLVVYSAGVFMPFVTASFGWSRGAYSSGFLVSTLVGLVAMPLTGRLADRFGPRPLALAGIAALAFATSALGLADAVLWHWWLLFAIYALAGSLMAPAILTIPVLSRFTSARGLALAVSLSGNGLGSAVWPPLATLYVARLGWRLAFAALAASWTVLALLLFVVFFHARNEGPPRAPRAAARQPVKTSYADALRSLPFLCLGCGGALFVVAGVAILVNFVPILRDRGLGATAAAGIAATAGITAIAGRLLTGFLLDRLPARRIAVVAFVLPALASLILLLAGASVPLAILAAVLLGFGLGAEMDISTYLAARYFGLERFGGVFAVIVAMYGVAAGLGPLLGNMIYDRTGSYALLLMAAVPVLLTSAALIALLPRPPGGRSAPEHRERDMAAAN